MPTTISTARKTRRLHIKLFDYEKPYRGRRLLPLYLFSQYGPAEQRPEYHARYLAALNQYAAERGLEPLKAA